MEKFEVQLQVSNWVNGSGYSTRNSVLETTIRTDCGYFEDCKKEIDEMLSMSDDEFARKIYNYYQDVESRDALLQCNDVEDVEISIVYYDYDEYGSVDDEIARRSIFASQVLEIIQGDE